MIITVTLNPSLDRTLIVPSFSSLPRKRVYLAESVAVQPSGKGINASLCLDELGVPGMALALMGPGEKHLFEAEFAQRRTGFGCAVCKGLTRSNTTVLDTAASVDVHLREPGFEADAEALDRLTPLVENAFKRSDSEALLVLSGSLPRNLEPKTVRRWVGGFMDRCTFVTDTSGAALEQMLSLRPHLIKPNEVELAGMADTAVESVDDALSAARLAQQKGARNLLISLGSQGAVLVTEDGRGWHAPAPEIELVNTVGAGDAALAGYLWQRDAGPEAALQAAVACGSAKCEEPTAGRLNAARVRELLTHIEVRPLGSVSADASNRENPPD